MHPPFGQPRQNWTVVAFASLVACLGWGALILDFTTSMSRSLAAGHELVPAVLGYIRYFTIPTNGGLATLMTATAVSAWRGRPPLAAAWYHAALVYMAVTCLTYEALLRRLWSPRGVQFWTDLTFHDVQPALIALFWIFCAPKRDLRWRSIPWLLVYPAIYFGAVEIAGAFGAGYPYDFLDATKLGVPTVLAVAGAFLALFLVLGLFVTAVARLLKGGPSAAASPRS